MTGFDLNKALTDIDERFIEEADIANTESRVKKETRFFKKGGKRVLRIALIAAGLVTLLAGTVAAATGVLGEGGIFKKKGEFKTIGSESEPEDLGDSYIPMGICKEGKITVTLEDVIGDKNVLYMEFSTNISVDVPDGWYTGYLGTDIRFEGDAVFAKGEYILGSNSGSAAFVRNGKLWYLYYLIHFDEDVDYSHRQIHVEATVQDAERETFVFDWTNNYTVSRETIPVNVEIGDFIVTEIRLSKTQMMIIAKTQKDLADAELAWKELLPVDYVKLTDGTVWYYDAENGVPVKHNGGITNFYDENYNYWNQPFWNYNLLGEFSKQDTGDYPLLPYDQIESICISGTVIKIR